MTNKNTPPRNGSLKLPPAYQAMLGQPRTCPECGETKPVQYETFAPSRKSRDGVSPVCRQCQGKGARRYQMDAGMMRGKPGETLLPPNRIDGFATDPRKDFEAFEREIDAYCERLATFTRQSRPDVAEIETIKRALTAATRLHGDPVGGGQMSDERLAFKVFMRVLRPTLADWCELGAIHEDIIDALLSKASNVVLLASRGSAKSTITSMYATWLLWRDPEHETILIVSRSENHAKNMLKAIRAYLEVVPLLAELHPDDDQLDSAFQLEVAPAKGRLGMSTSVTCRGLTGQITGLRARRIIGDDVENPKDETPEAVDHLEEAIGEFQHIVIPGGTVTLLGTPQSPFSLYGRLSRSEAWTTFRACLFNSDILDGKEVFESRWPARFPPEEIEKKRKAVSKRAFALHYRLDLTDTADKEQPFRLSDLPVLALDPLARFVPLEIRGGGDVLTGLPRGSAELGDEWRAVGSVSQDTGTYTQVVAAVDPAGGLRGGKSDAIGLAIIGITAGGRGIIRVCRGIREDTTAAAYRAVARIIAAHGVNKLIVEETKGGLYGSQLVAHLAAVGYPLSYDAVTTGGVSKGRRIIEAISPALASGKLFICRSVLEAEEAADFVIQYTGISYDARKLRNDDIIDALAYAVAACGRALAADEAEFVAAQRYTLVEYTHLPLRRRVLNEDELEAIMDDSESEERLRLQLDRSLEIQAQEYRRGLDNPALQRRIDALMAELRQIQEVRGRFDLPGYTQPTTRLYPISQSTASRS